MAESLTVRLRSDPDLHAAMKAYQERYGTPLSEQVKRALRAFLQSEGFLEPKGKPDKQKRVK